MLHVWKKYIDLNKTDPVLFNDSNINVMQCICMALYSV